MDWKLEVIVIPVSDVDRARQFYETQVGFNVDVDHRASDTFRVVQLDAAGLGLLGLVRVGLSDSTPGSVKGLQLVVSDVVKAQAELAGRGVEVSSVRHMDDGVWADGPGGDWNSFIFFSDPDGNSWTIQQKPASA